MNYFESPVIDAPAADHVSEKLVGMDLAINISREVANDAFLGKPDQRGESGIGDSIPDFVV